jgi:hypothetical protein
LPFSCLYQLASNGVSCWQGPHQEAQKFTMTGLPWYWLSETLPGAPRAATENVGAAGAGVDGAAEDVARLTATIAAANTATLPDITLCRQISRATPRTVPRTLVVSRGPVASVASVVSLGTLIG